MALQEQVVKVGLKVLHELGERTRRTEAELQAYRTKLVRLAARAGMEVPAFFGKDGGDGGEFDPEQMREWLGGLLSGPLSGEGKPRAGGGRARDGALRNRRRGDGRAAGPWSKRPVVAKSVKG